MKIKEVFDGSKVLFMSDLHYNHENIIKFNQRPFENATEMNSYIEGELSKRVGSDNILFDLGDLFWRVSETKMKEIIQKTNAERFYKIIGNHDKEKVYQKSFVGSMFTGIYDLLEIKVAWEEEIYTLILSHYPMVSWNHKPRGSFMLFGHCHGNIDQYMSEKPDLAVDIGFDGDLVKEYGTFILPFPAILSYMERKAGGTREFMKYVQGKCKEL